MSTEQMQDGQNDEIQALRTAISSNPELGQLKLAVELIHHTGARFGELIPLRWDDVDIAERKIYLSSQSRRRWVPLDPDITRLLQTRMQRERPAEFVFGSSPRAVLNRAQRQLAQVKSQQGTKIGFHTLRRAFAQRLADTGYLSADSMGSILGL